MRKRNYGCADRIVGLNGRVHLPAWIREPLDIKRGDTLTFDYNKEAKIIIIKKSK